jgi:DNA repair exonuclease SbcCD ATPase subunit
LEHGRSQDRPINVVSKRLNEILEEKEYLSQFIEKKYDIEESKQKLEEEIREQQINIEILTKLKQVEDKYELEQEKIKISENTINEYQKKIDETNFPQREEIIVSKKQKNSLELIIAIVLIIISAISVLLIKNDVISAITIVLAIIATIYAGYIQYRKKLEFNITKQEQNVDNNNQKAQIEVMQATIKNLKYEQDELKEKIKSEYNEEIEKIRNEYIGIVPIKTIDELLSKKAARIEIEVANNKIGENKLKIQSIGLDRSSILPKLENLSALEEEYSKLEEEYKNLTFQNEAIELAKQELEQAYYQMKKKVTPSFTTKLSQIMEKVSDGKYTNIKLDEKDGLIVEIQNGDYVPVEYLSVGTIDQLYLSLRLSAGAHISNENLPIILDEAFAYYDDERLANILEFLNNEYSNRQIIILTCTNREQNILQRKNINYNYIEI